MCAYTQILDEGNSKHTTLAFTHFFLTSGQEDLTQTNLECFSCCLPGFSYITTAITEALQVVIVLNADV